MYRRTAIAVAAALLGLAPLAHAAQKPQIVDPKGDYPVPVGDIVSVTFSTVPKGLKEQLQLDMVVAEAPSTNTPYSYTVRFLADECSFSATYYGHPFEGVFSDSGVGCQAPGSTELPVGTVKVSGTHIIFTVKFDKFIKRGALLEDLVAETAVGGAASGGVISSSGDRATGTEWVIGSDRKKKK
jgi:hypothetical protein